MQKSIRNLIRQIPNTTGAARIELGRRIVASGEPAIPILIETLNASNAETRGMAAWLLGFTNDPRTADALYQATGDCDSLVAYEAAASLVRMGDRRGVCRTITGLEDPDPRVRAKCLDVLQQKTGETYGFLPDDAPHERAAAVARWKAWGASLPGGGL
jgi:HEAT repeat protein